MRFSNDRIPEFVREFYPNLGTILSTNTLFLQENSETYKISTKKGQYVLHHNKFDSTKRIEKMCQILDEISKNNSKVIQLIKNKNNAFSENKCFLTKFKDGNKFSGTKKEFLDLARNLSCLHSKLEKSNTEYSFRPNQNYYSFLTINEINKINKILEKNKQLTKTEKIIRKNFLLIVNELERNSLYFFKNSAKKQIIHFDLHPGNVLFDKKSVNMFLDFNSMRYGHAVEDVIFSAFRFASQIDKNPIQIYKLITLYLKKYYDEKIIYNKYDLEYFLIRSILYRICFILKKYFFHHSTLWISDIQNQLNYLKLAKKTFR